MEPSLLTSAQAQQALTQLPGWTQQGSAFTRTLKTATFMGAVELIERIALVAEAQDHHPDLQLSYVKLTLPCSTHDAGGLTQKDVDLCRALNPLLDAAAA